MNGELKYYDELAYIIFEDGLTKEFYLRGYLIDFTIYTDSIYQIISIREGEVGLSVALTMINSEFKIIDSQRLSIHGGDEEYMIIQKGCFRNKNEYFSENTVYSPLITDSVYTETFFELKLTIQSNGEILEEEQGRITDTIIAKITPGDYRNFEKSKTIRILQQNKVQILSYDEKGVRIDSIFGNYHYNSRERNVGLYLFIPYQDEFEIDTYKYLNDTARVSMNQNCILYKKEDYCIN